MQLAKWLRLALDAAKSRGMTEAKVIELSGVSADRVYAYLRGEGGTAKAETIIALAKAAEVPIPRIGRSLDYSDAAVGSPPVLALLRDAAAAIDVATGLLEREEASRAAALADVEANRLAAATEAKTKTSDDEDSKAS